MSGHISVSVREDCYALTWSYGMICVHCGCCSKDTETRQKARLRYWSEECERCESFSEWADDPEVRKLQEENIASDWRIAKKRERYYRCALAQAIREMQGGG